MYLRAFYRGISACQPLNGRAITSKYCFSAPHRRYAAGANYELKYAEKLRTRAEE